MNGQAECSMAAEVGSQEEKHKLIAAADSLLEALLLLSRFGASITSLTCRCMSIACQWPFPFQGSVYAPSITMLVPITSVRIIGLCSWSSDAYQSYSY